MQELTYQIKDPIGLHARPAGALVRTVKGFQSKVTVFNGEKSAAGTALMALMALCIRTGQTVRITVEGDDEEPCAQALKTFLEENL